PGRGSRPLLAGVRPGPEEDPAVVEMGGGVGAAVGLAVLHVDVHDADVREGGGARELWIGRPVPATGESRAKDQHEAHPPTALDHFRQRPPNPWQNGPSEAARLPPPCLDDTIPAPVSFRYP